MALFAASAQAAAVPLGTAANFGVLAGSTVTNAGPSVVSGGHVGVSPGSAVTGFGPGAVTPPSTIYRAGSIALQAKNDLTTAYDNVAGRSSIETIFADLAGRTLAPGVYSAASSLALNGELTLDANGDPNAVFVFQAGSTLQVGTTTVSRVRLINGAQAANVFWQVGSSATIGVNSAFTGNILALTSITMQTNTTLNGRALAANGAVTLETTTITTPAATPAPPLPPPPPPVPPFLPFLPLDLSAELGASGIGGGILEGPIEGDPPIDPDDFKTLYGYNGPSFNPTAQTGKVEVLSDTVHRRDGAAWGVYGLARNQTADTVGRVVVTAQLRGAQGELLDTVTSTSAVQGVRPGEPAPFALASEITASTVAEVSYSATGAAAGAVSRQFSYTLVQARRYGDDYDIANVYPGVESASPNPYLLASHVENLGAAAVTPTLTAAWLDADGRVVHVAAPAAIRGTGGEDDHIVPDSRPISPGESGAFLYISDDPELAPELAAEVAVWIGSQTR